MGLCLSLESPSFDYIYVNSLRDFFVVRFSNPLDRPPFSEAFLFVASLFLLSLLYDIKYNLSSFISNYFYIFLLFYEHIVCIIYFLDTKRISHPKCPLHRFVFLLVSPRSAHSV